MIGAEGVTTGTVADPGAGTTMGRPTLATSDGWMIGGQSASTSGSMFQRRNFMLSTWKRTNA